MTTGWTLALNSFYRVGGEPHWLVGRDGTPIAPDANAPAELRGWHGTLNAQHRDAPHGYIIAERAACGNSLCPVAVTGGRWDVPADSRGRWCIALANGPGDTPHALGTDAADDLAPHLASLMHRHFRTEPGAVVRERAGA